MSGAVQPGAGSGSAAAALPAPKHVRDLLDEQLERAVQVAPTSPYAPHGTRARTLAVYVDARLRAHAVLAADLPFSVYAAAAAARVPAGATPAVLAEGWLGPQLLSRLTALLEAASSLFRAGPAGAVTLHGIYPPAQAAPPDVTAYAAALRRRLDLQVRISGYGAGRLSIVSAA